MNEVEAIAHTNTVNHVPILYRFWDILSSNNGVPLKSIG